MLGVDDNLSQIWLPLRAAAVTTARQPVNERPGARDAHPKAYPLVRTDPFTASILRTHSQCQRGSLAPSYRGLGPRISCLHLLEPVSSAPRAKPASSDRGDAEAGRACRVRFSVAKSSRLLRGGGAYRDRTDDLMLAKQLLSQLS